MTKSLLIATCLMVAAAQAQADTYGYVTFTTTTAEQSLASSGLTITFSDGKLIAANGSETQEFDLSTLQKFYFSTTTGVDAVWETAGTGSYIDVYTTQGVRLGRYASGTNLSEVLPGSVYVVKTNGETKKLIIR